MNEGELLTALRKKLKNIEAAGETRNSLTVHRILLTIKSFVFFPGSSDSESDSDTDGFDEE